MLSFRKWLPVLAVLALLMGTAVSANAQLFSCQANAGVPTTVRAEGLAELVGDVVLNCTGGTANLPFTANIQIFLNTNITSRLISGSSEATLLIDDNVATARQAVKVSENSVAWLGVPLTQPGPSILPTPTVRTIRITNVRANANMMGVSSTLIPNQIVMFISASGTQSIPINNPQQTVAFVQKGLSASLVGATGSGSAITGEQQCVSLAKTTLSAIKFSEGFATAFKTMGDVSNNTPGTVYSATESGLVIGTVGLATNGTRLLARFANIPAGVNVFVTVAPVGGGTTNAVLVSTGDATGTTGSVAAPIAGSGGLAPVTLTGGAGSAAWELTAVDPNALESVSFGIAFSYTANTGSNSPALGSGTVTGSFAPLSTVGVMSSTAPVPRFADVPLGPFTIINIVACQTNLLFPFVTTDANFDTGIAISNTSKDIFGTSSQAGACTINYFGTTSGGGAAPAAATSPTVNAGQTLVFSMFNGAQATLGIPATPGFTGYLIAQCKFQYAHGFAFISDLGSTKLAQGYLALVIADNADHTRPPSPLNAPLAATVGEMLTQ